MVVGHVRSTGGHRLFRQTELILFTAEAHHSAECHSEEPSDEESAFAFPFLAKLGIAQSRCFTSFSMTHQ